MASNTDTVFQHTDCRGDDHTQASFSDKAVSRKANFTVLLAHCSVSCPTHVTRLDQLICRDLSQCMIFLTDTGKDGRNEYYSALMKINIPADITSAAAVTCYKIPADQHAPFAPYSPYCSNDVRCCVLGELFCVLAVWCWVSP